MGQGMIDKFDIVAENYEDKYHNLAKEIFKEGLKLGYEKAKRPKSKWRVYEGIISCGHCGAEFDEMLPFCGMCGADMRA